MKALIVVDIQNDFLPGGSLGVPGGDEVIPLLNALMPRYPLVALTQDWHPPGHLSFASSHVDRQPFDQIDLNGMQQVLWPDHCVWDSPGARFADSLNTGPAAAIFRKGMDPRIDSYSALFDNGHRRQTGLADWLRAMDVDTLHIGGLAADFCVAYTARDAIQLGFQVAIIQDAVRAISNEAFQEASPQLRSLGITIAPASNLSPA